MPNAKRDAALTGRPISLRGPLGDFARAAGGTAALAELLGVTPRTLQRWAKTAPPPRAVALITRIAREQAISRVVREGLARLAPAATYKKAAHRTPT